MNKYINVLVFVLFMASQYGCDETLMYQESAKINFDLRDTVFKANGGYDKILWADSIAFSFVFYPEEITQQQMYLPVRIMGGATTFDRHFKVSVDEKESTAQEGVHYKALDELFVVRAGVYRDSFPIVFFRHEDLKTQHLKVVLKMDQGGDFKPGVEELSELIISFSDKIEKPNWWLNTATLFFGEYSNVKYRKLIEISGKVTIDMSPANRGELYELNALLRQYYTENPTKDENGEMIIIPEAF